jgi:hypothetical protein
MIKKNGMVHQSIGTIAFKIRKILNGTLKIMEWCTTPTPFHYFNPPLRKMHLFLDPLRKKQAHIVNAL